VPGDRLRAATRVRIGSSEPIGGILIVLKKAFTLIELLVVIAIIAILAAILFPVLSQARESAKDVTFLSNVKQTGLSTLMYATDFDDSPPLAQIATDNVDIMWQDASQPYVKNWDLMLNPKRERPTGPVADVQFKRTQYLGMPPVAAANGQATARNRGYYQWTQAQLTGGVQVQFDGIAGHGNMTAAGTDSYGAGRVAASSKPLSGIGNPSDMVMITESSNWDLWWSFGTGGESYAFNYCVQWTPANFSSYPGKTGYAGPTAFKRAKSQRSGINATCFIPDGLTTYVATDGSAKALDFRGKMLQRTQVGTIWVHNRFWPDGVN